MNRHGYLQRLVIAGAVAAAGVTAVLVPWRTTAGGRAWSTVTPRLAVDLTTPSTQTLPTIASALALTGRTFTDVWVFNTASGTVTSAGGSKTLVVGSTPRYQAKVPQWDGDGMLDLRAIEFTADTQWLSAPNVTDGKLDRSRCWVMLARLARAPATDTAVMGDIPAAFTSGYVIGQTGGSLYLDVWDEDEQVRASATAITNEVDGFADGSLQWWAACVNITTHKHRVFGYRAAGALANTPTGAITNVAAAFRIGLQQAYGGTVGFQLLWLGALEGAEAEAFDVDDLNALDTIGQAPSIFATYSRGSAVSPIVAYESGFGLRVQPLHGSTVTSTLVHFPYVYHPSATLSTQKLAAYFARGVTVATLTEGNNKRNLAVRTDDLSHASWTKSNVTATANFAEDPAGFTAASRLVSTAANGRVYEVIAVTANRAYSWSCFVRRGGGADVSVTLRAVDNADESLVGEGVRTATSEWTRVSLLSQDATATSIRYELEIDPDASTIYATFCQVEYGWLTEYQVQRGTRINRGDPISYIDNAGNHYYDPRGGRVEVTAVQYADDLVEDAYVFSTGLSDAGTLNSDRLVLQISDSNGIGSAVDGTIEEPYGTDVQHHDSAGNLVEQLGNYDINRNAEVVYGYTWNARGGPVYHDGAAAAVEQTGSTTSTSGPTVPAGGWLAAPQMLRLYLAGRYSDTTACECGIERVSIWGPTP